MIRQLEEGDAEAFAAIRREALDDAPLTFASSPDDDTFRSVDTVREHLRRGPDTVILGAFRPELVGVAGLYRDRHLKASHKAHLWGMYVKPGYRRDGVGAALLEGIVRHAASLPGVDWVHLTVTAAAPDARRLYERAGFETWGSAPDAMRHGGDTTVEHHMALRLTPDTP